MSIEIEEAAATLGVAVTELDLDAIRRNYREKVKYCHPDRATHPGAAADFKRITEALEVIERFLDACSSTADYPDIAAAAEGFTFEVELTIEDIHNSLSVIDRFRAMIGSVAVADVDLSEVPQGAPMAVRAFREGEQDPRKLTPLLIAPVACRVLRIRQVGFSRIYLLRPLQTNCVANYLQDTVEAGASIAEAVKRLTEELRQFARLPLTAA